jgi:hypothetical protein
LPAEDKDSDSPLSGNARIVAVVAAALIVAVIAFLLLSGGDDEDPGTAAPPPTTVVEVPPAIVSAADLRDVSAELGHPIYWLGPRPGASFELTREGNGDVYVRYLTGGAEAGDPRPRFVTVGTYPVQDAVAAVKRAAAAAGAKPLPIAHGGYAFVNPDNPTSVYFAYPGADYQVEVFAPKAAEALELVTSGKVLAVS